MKAGRLAGSHCAHCTGSKREGDLVRRFSLMSLVSAPIALALEKKIKKAKKPRKVQIEKAFSPFGHGLESSTSLRSFRGEAQTQPRPENFLFKRRFPFSFFFSSSSCFFFFFQRSFGTLGRSWLATFCCHQHHKSSGLHHPKNLYQIFQNVSCCISIIS